jgi:hypothetical protein
MALVGFHAGAMKENFLLVKIILFEKKPFFNQVNGISFFNQRIVLEKLMRKKNACPHISSCWFLCNI